MSTRSFSGFAFLVIFSNRSCNWCHLKEESMNAIGILNYFLTEWSDTLTSALCTCIVQTCASYHIVTWGLLQSFKLSTTLFVGFNSSFILRKVLAQIMASDRSQRMRRDILIPEGSTASLSHLRTMLPESSSRPLPAKWPNHATQSLFDSKSLYTLYHT